jgi:FKBP-type peptidyl-prolyl cis-trans isomerase FklB
MSGYYWFLLFISLCSPSLTLAAPDPAGLEYLVENAKKPGVITLPSGLQYKVLKKGDGKFHPTPDSPCLCHYEGRLISGKVFDSSYKRGNPTSFAPNQVIKGWTEAMQLMVEGDKWELYIPPDLGYGDSGAGGDIPAGATLIFVMELQTITGDKVPAVKCDARTGTDCNEQETKYLTKIKVKSASEQAKELERLRGMMTRKMTVELKDWIQRRIAILSQLVANDQETPDLINEL